MKKQHVTIGGIPAVLWGEAGEGLFIAVHGDQSHKEDDVISVFAAEAGKKGFQTLSFDLPEHGERTAENRLCNVQNAIADLAQVMDFARTISNKIGLFGCSLGAYFSMMAFRDEPIDQALFLSPVVDMKRIIENMMLWFHVSEERLEQEKEISTPIKTLYWDYYRYVVEHPVEWNHPTSILYGGQDNLSEYDDVKGFAAQTHGDLTVLEEGEHFFHTEEQLAFFKDWLAGTIKPAEGIVT